jgi:FAD/FMN-containing dehydrogenase
MNELVDGLSAKQLAGLRRLVNCPILTGDDELYDRARRVWNGMIDRKPSVIIRPGSIADVLQSVRFAREHGLAKSVRGGGHSVAGKAVAEGAIMIDLSLMRGVQIDTVRQTAAVRHGENLTARVRDMGSPLQGE